MTNDEFSATPLEPEPDVQDPEPWRAHGQPARQPGPAGTDTTPDD